MSYGLLKGLDWGGAVSWFHQDARDDFFPDPIRYADLEAERHSYLAQLEHRLLHFDRLALERYRVPKASHLSRDAVWLPVSFRVPYAAVIQRLFVPLKSFIHRSCYSSRYLKKTSGKTCPFSTRSKIDGWAQFENDFRLALGGHRKSWGVATDLSNYYEHISVDDLTNGLRELLPQKPRQAVEPYLEYLSKMLKWCSDQGVGLPQNHDSSSLLGDLFLTALDRRMCGLNGIKYFRYVDDIRVVARTRGAAIDALNQLQVACKQLGLFLNAAKTKLLEPDTKDWDAALDVRHQKTIGELDAAIESKSAAALLRTMPGAIEEFERASKSRDGRTMRALGNRLFEANKFDEVRPLFLPKLQAIALKAFRSQPDGSDHWCRLVSPFMDKETQEQLLSVLKDRDYNRHHWLNMNIVVALARSNVLSKKAAEEFRRIAGSTDLPVHLRGWAIVGLGRHGDGQTRKRIAREHLHAGVHPILRRCAVIATQELPSASRLDVWRNAATVDPELAALTTHLEKRETPRYDTFIYATRRCSPAPQPLAEKKSGFGLSQGQRIRFRLPLNLSTDYE